MDNLLESRKTAFQILCAVIYAQKTLDEAYLRYRKGIEGLSESDKQFVRLLVLTVLRRFGQIKVILADFLKKPLAPKLSQVQIILAIGVAQLLFLDTPAYATVDTSVRLVKAVKKESFARLVNGVLRSVERAKSNLTIPPAVVNIPAWLSKSWVKTYGSEQTALFAEMMIKEPDLDISVKAHPEEWAEKWQGVVLPTGSVRLQSKSNITAREGYQTGDWWVQEASASIPAQLFPDIKGKRVADLCSAPGGKTAQLAVRGAFVDAYDISEKRLHRLRENMVRLNLNEQVRVFCGDALQITVPPEGLYDAVLLDAPCSATGTIRRHPDLLFHRTEADVERLSQLQRALFEKAVSLLKVNGYLVYATCSLQQTENEAVIQEMLIKYPEMERAELAEKWTDFCIKEKAIQVVPTQNQDGFYAVLLRKTNKIA